MLSTKTKLDKVLQINTVTMLTTTINKWTLMNTSLLLSVWNQRKSTMNSRPSKMVPKQNSFTFPSSWLHYTLSMARWLSQITRSMVNIKASLIVSTAQSAQSDRLWTDPLESSGVSSWRNSQSCNFLSSMCAAKSLYLSPSIGLHQPKDSSSCGFFSDISSMELGLPSCPLSSTESTEKRSAHKFTASHSSDSS